MYFQPMQRNIPAVAKARISNWTTFYAHIGLYSSLENASILTGMFIGHWLGRFLSLFTK